MTQTATSPKDLFLAALELPQDARPAWLDEACSDNAALRRQVDALLRMHDEPDSLLDQPRIDLGLGDASFVTSQFAPTVSSAPISETPGTVIGPYKLLEQIGEGGFGVVFMAEQTAPVKRKVAVKVIKPGMDTREVIARFEAERQALALMDHPNIAKVFDGGTTGTGRPYFVMELVRGVPITGYCDENQLSPRQRLELFVTVCQAVQHAHQKGIIHRDIKPTNVLVTLHDDKPVVKVIDFGIAKATSGQLTDKTLFTGFAQLVGTPLYMSPEQASMNGLDVDTRSDIYSLGVLLYELLTGTTPFDKMRLQEAGFDEVRRIIREEEAQKPSTRLSELGSSRHSPSAVRPQSGRILASDGTRRVPATSLASIAAQRHTEPRKLTQLMRGDLDWIVMKALEKDRVRRYATASGFATDVMHYLADEPVTACPPSATYRFRKFASRNRSSLAAVFVILAALVAGVVVSASQAVRARNAEELADQRWRDEQQARRDAEAARNRESEARLEAVAQRDRAVENFRTARRAVDQLLTRVAEETIVTTPHMDVVRKQLLEDALQFYLEFVEQDGQDPEIRRETARAWGRVGRIYLHLDELDASRKSYREAIRRYDELAAEGLLTPDDRRMLSSLLSSSVWTGVSDANAIEVLNRATEIMQQLVEEDPESADLRRELADRYVVLGHRMLQANPAKSVEAEQALRQASLLVREEDDPLAVAWIHLGLAGALAQQGKVEAEQTYREAVRISRQLVDQPWGRVVHLLRIAAESTMFLGMYLHGAGRLDEAEQAYRECIAYWQEIVQIHPDVFGSRRQLALCHERLGAVLDAQGEASTLEQYQESVRVFSRLADEFPQNAACLAELGWAHVRLARILRARDRLQDSEASIRAAIEAYRRALDLNPQGSDSRLELPDYYISELAAACAELERNDLILAREAFELLLRITPGSATSCGTVARLLATCREPTLRDPGRAVELAQRAVELAPEEAGNWNTLGVAQYRAGDWSAALESLNKSQELDGDQNVAITTLFLAMAHLQLGHTNEAREWYDKAVVWMESDANETEELLRFRAEATELLGLPNAPLPTDDSAENEDKTNIGPQS